MDFLSISFLRIALLGALLSAFATSLISVFVALKKIAYMSEAFAHISFAGIALALLLGLNLNISAFVFVFVIAIIIAFISRKFKTDISNITTIFLAVSMSLGIIFISLNKNLNIDITSLLFGNILLINSTDIVYLIVLLFINLMFIVLFFKEMFYISYNEEIASLFKIRVNLVYFIFIGLIALNIVLCIKITGLILITAQLILPGLSSLNITKKIKIAIILSIIISLVSSFIGFISSYYLDLPTGSVIVLTLFIIFLLSLIKKRI